MVASEVLPEGFEPWGVAGCESEIFMAQGSCLPYINVWNMVFSLMPDGGCLISIQAKHIHMCMESRRAM
jgi:hypothetical protein